MGETDTEVLVVGAGQAGLSVAYYLRKFGLSFGEDALLVDRGPGSGGAWQFRWEALRLGVAHRVNDLPGMAELGLSFASADKSLPAREVVADYYRNYEEHYRLQVRRPMDVYRVFSTLDGFAVHFHGTGETLTTRLLVNATGTWGAPFVPWYPGRNDFHGRQIHTADYRNAEDFRGQDVLVVGGGTSAIGFLLELEGIAGELSWFTRSKIRFIDGAALDLEAASHSVALQDAAARDGRALPSIVSTTGVPRTRRIQSGIDRGLLVPLPMFTQIEAEGARLIDGSFRHADAIIWATGFRPELRHLAPLALREKEGGITVSGGSAYRSAGLFFAGYGPTASTIGANRAGRSVARAVMAALSAR